MATYGEVRKELTRVPGFSSVEWGRRVEVGNWKGVIAVANEGSDANRHPGDSAPASAYESSEWLTSYIAAALRLHSRDAYCTALLVAHLYVLAQDGPKDEQGNLIIDMPDAGGSVASGLSVGNLSMSYQRSSEEGAEWYEQTSYGRLFRMMEPRVNADRVRVV